MTFVPGLGTVQSMTTTKEAAQSALDELKRARDEIRVKVHLAGMEAKELWGKLEPKLLRLEQEIEEAGDTIATATGNLLSELGSSIRELGEKLKHD